MHTQAMVSHGVKSSVEPLLTPPEVARWLQVPVPTLYRWRYLRGGPQAVRVGRHLRYRRSEVERWLHEQAKEAR